MIPTIGEALDELAERDPRAPAVDDGVERLDRTALAERSRRLARLLLTEGVEPGQLVGVRGGNSASTLTAICAVWRAGGTPLPMNPALAIEEQRAIVQLAQPAVVLGAADHDLPSPGLPLDPDLSRWSTAPLPPLAAASWKAVTSSGSTGTPKVVIATGAARVDPRRRVSPFLPLAARQLVVAPITHAAPFTYAMRGLTTGHALVLLPRFDELAVLEKIAAQRITWTLLSPATLHRLLRLPADVLLAADLSSIEQIVHMGAPIDPALKRRVLTLFGPERVTEVYAGSESNGLTVIRGDDWLEHPGSVGRPASGTELRVVDENGHRVPPGVTGRVEMRRATGSPYRYIGSPAPVAGSWDTLGDDGHLDRTGYLYLADRSSDRIQRNGSVFYPAQIERILERHPAVRGALVTGTPEGRLRAVADIADAIVTPEELLTWTNAHLPDEQRIDVIATVRAPVRDDAGKGRRRALRG